MQQTDPETTVPTELASLREYALYFGNLQHQRLNIFLVAESVLFAGVATTLDPAHQTFRAALSSFGLMLTLLLWRTLVRMQRIVDRADRELTKVDDVYRRLMPLKSSFPMSWFLTRLINAWWLPAMFASAWVLILSWSTIQ